MKTHTHGLVGQSVGRIVRRVLSTVAIVITVVVVGGISVARADFSVTGITPASGFPEAVAGQQYSLGLVTVGGTAPYVWSISGGSLPDGLVINPSSGAISGVPTTAGTYVFTVQVQDANSNNFTQDYTLSVYPSVGGFSYERSPSGSAISNPVSVHIKGVFGADFCDSSNTAFQLNIISSVPQEYDAGFLIASIGTAVDQNVSFPTLSPGTYTQVRLQCLGGPHSGQLIMLENADPAFSVIGIGPDYWSVPVVGQPYSFGFTVNGGTAPYTWSVIAGSLPDGLTLDSSTGRISGTPTTAGPYSFTVQVQESGGGMSTRYISLPVSASVGGFFYSRSPSGSAMSNPITVHIRGVFGADFCDTSNSNFSVSAVSTLGGEYLAGYGNVSIGTGIDRDFNFPTLPSGQYQMIRINCIGGPHNGTFMPLETGSQPWLPAFSVVGISPENGFQEPVAGQAYALGLSVSGMVSPLVWSISSGNLPNGLSIDSSTGRISGTPTTPGTYSFTAQVQDANSGVATRNYTLSVYPSVGGFQYSRTPSGSSVSGDVMIHIGGVFGADFCDNSSAAYMLTLQGRNGDVVVEYNGPFHSHSTGDVVNDNAVFSNLPPASYTVYLRCQNPNPLGFEYIKLSDSFGAVNNTPPTFSPISDQTVLEGQTLTFAVSATDPDGDALTYSASNLPAGALFDVATRTFTWTPSYGQAGNYTNVEFTVTDNGTPMMLDTELITISVGHVNRPPVFSPTGPQTASTTVPLLFTVSATDPDNDAVVLSASDLPSGSTFNPGTGVFSWTPTYNQSGVYAVNFIATDNGTPTIASSTLGVVITVSASSPTVLTQNLIDRIVAANYPTNQLNSYLANLRKVGIFIDNGKIQEAINQLNAFIQKVNQDYSHGLLVLADKNYLVGAAQNIITTLQ
ncbi:putative Ig domain-containing protein [Patescibacteria group bacterium]|nr:putative Ig domain-containing protein [Patescibacteria group bacterium]